MGRPAQTSDEELLALARSLLREHGHVTGGMVKERADASRERCNRAAEHARSLESSSGRTDGTEDERSTVPDDFKEYLQALMVGVEKKVSVIRVRDAVALQEALAAAGEERRLLEAELRGVIEDERAACAELRVERDHLTREIASERRTIAEAQQRHDQAQSALRAMLEGTSAQLEEMRGQFRAEADLRREAEARCAAAERSLYRASDDLDNRAAQMLEATRELTATRQRLDEATERIAPLTVEHAVAVAEARACVERASAAEARETALREQLSRLMPAGAPEALQRPRRQSAKRGRSGGGTEDSSIGGGDGACGVS
jgi:chromosome segregation ATPase